MKSHFGLVAGHRTASGDLVDQLMTNEVTGSDTAPGFRVLDGGDPPRAYAADGTPLTR